MSILYQEGERWGLWIDILTINQHQGEKTTDDLSALDRVIGEIGKVVFVIDADGTAMTRVWCLFEIMSAVKYDADITAVFMGNNGNVVQSALIALSVLCGRFDNIDVREAQATVASDKEVILKQVEESIGIDEMNAVFKATLKSSAQKEEFEKKKKNFGSLFLIWNFSSFCGARTRFIG
jgi:hypothetical protein